MEQEDKKKSTEEDKTVNTIAGFLKGFAVLILICGVFFFFVYNFFFVYLVVSTLSFALMYGFGEIIQKLENIEKKLNQAK